MDTNSSSLFSALQSIAPGWWPVAIGGAAILLSMGELHYEINDHETRLSKLEVIAPEVSKQLTTVQTQQGDSRERLERIETKLDDIKK